MAEVLAIVGVAANIIQLADFSARVIRRLNDFQSNLEDVPEALRSLKIELPVLHHTVETIRSVDPKTQRILGPTIDGCLQQIKSLDEILDSTLPVAGDSWTKRSKKAIVSLKQESKVDAILKVLRGYMSTLTFYYTAATTVPMDDQKLRKISQWLSPPMPSTNHDRATKQRQADTGVWFLKSQEYSRWKGEAPSLIWLHGIPGCGKTVLSSTVINDILLYSKDDVAKAVAYFYFDFKDIQKQGPGLMIRSLICQLSQRCTEIPDVLESLYTSSQRGQECPSLDTLLEVLHQFLLHFPEVFIVIDALDECNDVPELMRVLEQIKDWRIKALHLLLTSRKEHAIQSVLDSFVYESNQISLQNDVVDEDILKYVRQRLIDDRNLRKWQNNPAIREEIETTLMKGAHGMFRWAACQLDMLSKCVTQAMVRKTLQDLPPTLDATYERILCGIDDIHSELAVRVLTWLAFSARPVDIVEIQDVVAIDVDRDPAFDYDDRLADPLDIQQICSSLIVISSTMDDYDEDPECISVYSWCSANPYNPPPSYLREGIVELAHYSVKEYLISKRISQGQARRYGLQPGPSNAWIAKACLAYFLQGHQQDSISDQAVDDLELTRYAAEFWVTHAHAGKDEAQGMNGLIIDLFTAENAAFNNWVEICNQTTFSREDKKAFPEGFSRPLYYASLCGFTEPIKLLLTKAANVNAQGGYYGNALQATAVGGYSSVVELLLTNGAEVNAQGGEYGSALQAGCAYAHSRVVELLLENGADINAQGGCHGSALQAASYKGDLMITRLLLAKGADVNLQDGINTNALWNASKCGNLKIAELLLTRGADPNAQGSSGSALYAASSEGNLAIVELLLTKHVNVNAQGGFLGSALQAASQGGYLRVIKLLLAHGANIDTQEGFFGNALQVASDGGHSAIVKLLLDKGADVNAQGGLHGNALYPASMRGFTKIVKLLLAKGADANAQGGEKYHNVLQVASIYKHPQIARLLVDNGADVKMQGGVYGNVLQAASFAGQIGLIKILLAKGADVNAQGGEYGTALQAAARQGFMDTVKLLIANGADVNIQGGKFGNALQAASYCNRSAIVEVLLAEGADKDAGEGYYAEQLKRSLEPPSEREQGCATQ